MAAQKHQLPEILADGDHGESSLGQNIRRHPPAVPPQPADDDNEDSEGIDPADLPEFIEVDLADVRKEFTCAICLEIIKETRTHTACMNRFCKTCIEKHMRASINKKCPICCSHFESRRSLKQDPAFDKLINVLFTEHEKDEEEHQFDARRRATDASKEASPSKLPATNGSCSRGIEGLSWARRSRTKHVSASDSQEDTKTARLN